VFQNTLFPVERIRDDSALEQCARAPVVALDIETETRWPGQGPRQEYGLSYSAEITVIALAWRAVEGYQTTALSAPFDSDIPAFLQTLFREKQIVAHNAVFDIRQLSKLTAGLTPTRIWDTMVMARLLHPQAGMSYSLLGVAAQLAVPFSPEQAALKAERNALHRLPIETVCAYAQADARVALAIYEAQRDRPTPDDLVDWECRAMREYCHMTAQGIRLNLPFIAERLRELRELRDAAAARLRSDGLLAPGSPKARAKYLYEHKRIPLPKWAPDSPYFTRAGRRRLSHAATPQVTLADLSTSAEVITSYIKTTKGYAELLRDLADYLDADWLISTLESLRDHAAVDGRIHSLITIATDTGRRAASHPQTQNWKMPDMAGIAIGDPGFTLVEVDYTNAENVMAAMISGDSQFAAACATVDFHAAMAERYFGERWQRADAAERKHLRGLSKRLNYGIAYGMGAARLSESIEVSLPEGQAFLRAYDAAFPALVSAKRRARTQVQEAARLHLWTGRPVALTQPFVAWNYLCQGGVSEMLKRAIVLLSETYRERGMRSRVALDIHDAFVLEVAHPEWDTAIALASQMMEQIVPAPLIHRTQPPAPWRAQPKLEENRHKWGYGQWYPE
jgi:DNA polymerase-1